MGTGTGARVLEEELGLEKADEFQTLAKAAELLLPSVHDALRDGRRDLQVHPPRAPGDAAAGSGIADYQTNGDCAAGTGSFMDQQASRLRYRIEDVGDIVLGPGNARRRSPGAAACSPRAT